MAGKNRPYRLVQITKVAKHGDGLCVVLNRQVRDVADWQRGDPVAVRQCGEMLLLEKINLNDYAKLRTGQPVPQPGS
jgi:hypothetical protein